MLKERIRNIRESVAQKSLDAAVFSDSFSIRFFSGFLSSNALFLVSKKKIFLFTDARYLVGAKEFFSSTNVEVRDFPNAEEWKDFLKKLSIQTLGIEMNTISVTRFREWEKSFSVALEDVSAEISLLRSQKSKEEITAAEKAANIADSALGQVLPLLKPGVSEKEFAWKLEKAGRERGAEKVSFDAIVAFGEHSAVPHHHPTDRKLRENEAVLIDWGFIANGFCSDCTRCFYMGTPSEQWLKTYKKVFQAQEAGMKKIFPNADISEVQKEAERILCEKIQHSFGHGVGLEVHEYPTLSVKTKGKFAENMIVTAEPGLYRAGKFGIRIEDMGVIEKTGFRSLTKFPKDFDSFSL